MTRKSLTWLTALVLLAGFAAQAADIGGMLLKTVAVGAVVNAVAGPANSGINKLVGGNGPGVSTKVVPVLSVGEKGYVGAAQVAGSASLIGKTKAVLQLEKDFSDRQYRIKLMVPINSVNPIGAKRVKGVGITGLLDVALSRSAYVVPASVGWNAGDVLKAGAIAVATKEFSPQINGFINTVFKAESNMPDGATKVVPYLDVGTKAYIGMMQVAGPAAAVNKVKAVWQYDQLFDGGRVRLRALVPSNSVNPLSIKRVKGVGCTAVIDAMALRTKEVERYPDHYRYFQSAPLFVGLGEDPRYRPPGWDQGRKEGWAKHGNPLLPPGQAKKVQPPVIVVPNAREKRIVPDISIRDMIGKKRPNIVVAPDKPKLRPDQGKKDDQQGDQGNKGRGRGKGKAKGHGKGG